MNVYDEILVNPILHQLKERYEQTGDKEKLEILYLQTAKGIAQYGHSVEPKEFTSQQWRRMRLEELVDADVYELCERARKKMEGINQIRRK